MKRRRVLIADARADGRYLRVTWHAEEQTFVLSTWSDEVCSGAIRIPVAKAPELITLFSDGLGDAVGAASRSSQASQGSQPAASTARAQLDDMKRKVNRFAERLRASLRK